MTFTITYKGSNYFTADANEIIGVAKNYLGCRDYSVIILLRGGGRYEFPFPMKDNQLNIIRQNWLLARAKDKFSPDVVIDV